MAIQADLGSDIAMAFDECPGSDASRDVLLRAMERTNVSELDPRTLGNTRPGALAFRLLQADWVVTVGIETLEPWVTVQSLQEMTVRGEALQ